MAVNFSEIKGLIDSSLGNLKEVTINADSSSRGATSSFTGSGLFIKRTGEVTGSLSGGNITLEGGGLGFSGALTQDDVSPYFTRAQRTVLASIISYLDTYSEATISNNIGSV